MIIKKLNIDSKTVVMEYLKKEPAFNLFIIGDIENYGFNQDFQTVWGSFDRDGKINGILLKYYRYFIVYSYLEEVLKDFSKIITNHDVKTLSGRREIIDKIKKYIPENNIKEGGRKYFSRMKKLNREVRTVDVDRIKRAGVEDIDRIIELLDNIEEFGDIPINKEAKIKEFEDNNARAYYIENESGQLIATAGSTAENSASAMVISVATHKDYRNRGLATGCVYKLCSDLISEGMIPCLFYDNRAAGRIYRRIGFEEIGEWDMLFIEG